jgi:hypothetical protein
VVGGVNRQGRERVVGGVNRQGEGESGCGRRG